MRLFSYKGFSMVIMLRDEHCPPHAHVDAGTWSARFKFSLWHNSVELWEVVPHSRRPPVAVLEGLRHALGQPACYEPETNKTLLALMGVPEGVEIEL